MAKMKNNKSKGFNRPLESLSSHLKLEQSKSSKSQSEDITDDEFPLADDDNSLFLNAMSDVKPISRKNVVETRPRMPKTNQQHPSDDREIVSRLNNLVDYGEGYVVSSTPEYIEGTGYNVHPEISRRLHRGKFSIQAHIDLHGMKAIEAQSAFDSFIKNSISRGYRALLVIHGRGLSSPNKPVLKPKVFEWLTQGIWRKWVIAFSSARSSDGGAGATYVLLRKNPVTKRYRKKRR